jgi:hypothetical protein
MVIVPMNRFFALIALISISTAGCARSGPLPGDSVSAEGGVTLSPPRLSTSPTESREAKEGLGPVESRLYPPELVMDHQGELGITPEQKKAIITETERGQSEMIRLQWDLQAEKEKLVKILDGDHLDEAKVQDIAKGVMDRESKVKASHLGMLVRVKNILTSEQITKLRDLRSGAQTAAKASPPFTLPSPSPSSTSSPSPPVTTAPPATHAPSKPTTGGAAPTSHPQPTAPAGTAPPHPQPKGTKGDVY